MNKIESYYDQEPEKEWERPSKARVQFDIAMQLISEHSPPPQHR